MITNQTLSFLMCGGKNGNHHKNVTTNPTTWIMMLKKLNFYFLCAYRLREISVGKVNMTILLCPWKV